MKWRCGLFVLLIGATSLVAGCCAHAQGNITPPAPTAAATPAQANKIAPPPPVIPSAHPIQVPPPAVLQAPPPQPLAGVSPTTLDKYLAFDKDLKEVHVPDGTTEAHFSFNITNISSGDVIINGVQTSCGCTVAKLPSQPWKLAPNEGGEISATMQLSGVPPGGDKTKTLTVNADKGSKLLMVKAYLSADSAPAAMSEMQRTNNLNLAKVDRQAVFMGDCARCHVTPAKDAAGHDKLGQDLYTAVCGICHNAEHQASFVPNLAKLPTPTSAEFWRNSILHGKPGTLMPAFAKAERGILSDEQVDSLVQYLTATIPSRLAVPLPPPGSLKVQ